LELVNNILERTARSKGAVGSNDVGIIAISGIDDGLVVQLIDLSVESDSRSLLELDVVLDAVSSVQEVGDHGGISHPVGDSGGEVVRRGSLAIGNASSKAGRGSINTLLSLLGNLLALLGHLLALLRELLGLASGRINITALHLGERRSVGGGRKKRCDENVLHVEKYKSDLPMCE
jgi:hypothetical protein